MRTSGLERLAQVPSVPSRTSTQTSTEHDPDLLLVAGFPATRVSLARKFLRDITGLTGIKFVIGRVLMDAGVLKWSVANDIQRLPKAGRRWWSYPLTFVQNASGMLITNGVLLGILSVSGHGWLYGVWVLAYVTPFPLFIRIRSLAEHACRESSRDVLRNTRTTRTGRLARSTVPPLRVNFHIEHHLMASVPHFRLPQRNARSANARLVLWRVGAAKRKQLFTRAARKEAALSVRSAIMPILSEVASYDFRP